MTHPRPIRAPPYAPACNRNREHEDDMTTHTTRDGRPVTIDKTGKRWMRGWIVQDGATFRPRWHLNGEHPRDEALDLTPVAAPRDAEIERLRVINRQLVTDFNAMNQHGAKQDANLEHYRQEVGKLHSQIERLRGMNAELVAFFQGLRPWMGETSRGKFDAILARNGGAK